MEKGKEKIVIIEPSGGVVEHLRRLLYILSTNSLSPRGRATVLVVK
jgi:hypothetical protein